MPAVGFPQSSTPGNKPGEGQGILLNCFAVKEGDLVYWRSMPGLAQRTALPAGKVRGMMRSGPFVYAVVGTKCVQIDSLGNVVELYGTVAGTRNVTITQNNEVPPRIVIVSDYSNQIIEGLTLQAYPDPDLPFPNSVTSFNGYFIFTTRGGDIWASDLNSTDVNPLSFAKAQSERDGLLRGIAANGIFYAFGQNTVTPYTDAGTIPFPLQRAATVISVGLAGPSAVAGDQYEWDKPPIFVATDDTVRILSGYETRIVSTPDVQRMISAVVDKTTLEACVYDFNGYSVWSLSSPDWTWDYFVSLDRWVQRESYGQTRWRARQSVFAFGKWLFADNKESILTELRSGYRREVNDAMEFGADSAPLKEFPHRTAVAAAFFDFTLGMGDELGDDPIETSPQVALHWSHDGGATWSNPLLRPLNRQGKFAGPIRINRLGMTTHHGLRLGWRITDPVDASFMAASAEGSGRAA